MLRAVSFYNFKKLFFYSLVFCSALAICFAIVLALWTRANLNPAPTSLRAMMEKGSHAQILDRNGVPLNVTYQNNWNVHNVTELHDIPTFLKTAFILSEDKRFYRHKGLDWRARFSALATNLKAGRAVRGASTISEQTLRMIYPRPRTIRSRWLEGYDSQRLEDTFSKDEILEFYLNQIPYAANRRGVTQAAYYYFNRDLETLSQKEMLALAVLVRAPGRMDLWKDTKRVEGRVESLAGELVNAGHMTERESQTLLSETLKLDLPKFELDAKDFVAYVKALPEAERSATGKIKTSLDANLQNVVQDLLDNRLQNLKNKAVNNGAVLVVDHSTGEILTWAVAGTGDDETPGRFIDAVTTRRQPGSALKPFLYGLALESGWSAATIIEDKPLIEAVGNGLHSYQNYSRSFYGPVTMRNALGNSLNIPALKTLQHVGAENYLKYLSEFGFEELTKHPNFYGDGIALGNGEVSLFELVQAFTAIANQGVYTDISVFPEHARQAPRRVMSSETASLLGNILSDPKARQLEFGEFSVLNFPVQTAVKTGTSSDYRDSWAVGFNYRYTVGIWMGNLDQTPTDGVTGSTGPGLLLRSVFARLSYHEETRGLHMDPKLERKELCTVSAKIKHIDDECESYVEWFTQGSNLPEKENTSLDVSPAATPIMMRRPVNGLHLAFDPRLPASVQAFEFYIQGLEAGDRVNWTINGETVMTNEGTYNWPVTRGDHVVYAKVFRGKDTISQIAPVHFLVK